MRVPRLCEPCGVSSKHGPRRGVHRLDYPAMLPARQGHATHRQKSTAEPLAPDGGRGDQIPGTPAPTCPSAQQSAIGNRTNGRMPSPLRRAEKPSPLNTLHRRPPCSCPAELPLRETCRHKLKSENELNSSRATQKPTVPTSGNGKSVGFQACNRRTVSLEPDSPPHAGISAPLGIKCPVPFLVLRDGDSTTDRPTRSCGFDPACQFQAPSEINLSRDDPDRYSLSVFPGSRIKQCPIQKATRRR